MTSRQIVPHLQNATRSGPDPANPETDRNRPTTARPRPLARTMLQRACACGRHNVAHAGNGGECAECRKKRLGLQRRAVAGERGHGPDVAPPIVHDVLRSPGRPLDEGTRGFMESRFGHDFSGVRVHTDARAAESARAVNALAYTVGHHVAFDAGQYAPATRAGRGLLAHELTHVAQQSAALQRLPATLPIDAATDPLESQARATAAAVMNNRPVHVQPAAAPALARQQAAPAQRRTDTITAPDGTRITRTMVPGDCRQRPTSHRATTGDVGPREAFFEIDTCSGARGQTLRGTLDYSDVIERFGNLLTTLPSQSDPQQALRDFETTLRQSTPRAQIRYTLQFEGFRFQTTAAGGGNAGGGGDFQVNGLLRYTNGQFNIHLEAGHRIDFSGGSRSGGNTTLVLNTDLGPIQVRFSGGMRSVTGAGGDTETWNGTGTVIFPLGGGVGIGLQGTGEQTTPPGGAPTQSGTIQIVIGTFPRLERERGRDCFTCACEEPTINCVVERPGGGTPQTPSGPPRMTRYFPLFYEYARANPRPDWQQQYNATLQSVANWLEQGYTISRIEGRTSPEGPLYRRRTGGFENASLAQEREVRARGDLRAVIRDRAGPLLSPRSGPPTPAQRNLRNVLRSIDGVPGGRRASAELFGSIGEQEVSEANMFRHLTDALRAPAAGAPDPLVEEHILGEGLTAETVQEALAALEPFRPGATGPGGAARPARRLTRSQKLEQVFRLFRRALIVLEPPLIGREDLFIGDMSRERAQQVLEASQARRCSPQQRALIDSRIPLRGDELFDVDCEERR